MELICTNINTVQMRHMSTFKSDPVIKNRNVNQVYLQEKIVKRHPPPKSAGNSTLWGASVS